MNRRLARWACVVAGLIAMVPVWAADAPAAPAWVTDPARPGEHLPGAGGSLFDALFTTPGGTHAIPFPFERLLARIDAELARDPASALPPLKAVLIPMGRSLQRSAAAPDYFRFPRVVVGVDAPPAPGSPWLLKDRLYIGYLEKSAVLEVISYNEGAGRFEFQLVKDYRAGGNPQVYYANRNICMACHHNAAPIFSRALWDETNANPAIAARLAAEGRSFHGIAPARGVDMPYAIDNAVRRANRLALTQRLWQEGCGPAAAGQQCRAGLFVAALRLRLADGLSLPPEAAIDPEAAATLRRNAARRWPDGLALGRPDLPHQHEVHDAAHDRLGGVLAQVPVLGGTAPRQPRLPLGKQPLRVLQHLPDLPALVPPQLAHPHVREPGRRRLVLSHAGDYPAVRSADPGRRSRGPPPRPAPGPARTPADHRTRCPARRAVAPNGWHRTPPGSGFRASRPANACRTPGCCSRKRSHARRP